jgi:hypothetical protein
MAGKWYAPAAIAVLCSGMAAAQPATGTFELKLSVPVHCVVNHQGSGVPFSSEGNLVALGELQEYCNAPRGYELVVTYTPGTLRGARLNAGNDQIVLNGSGEEVVSRVAGPRIQARQLSAEPGETGFDTDRLLFELRPV